MTSPAAIARNHAAIRSAASLIEAANYPGDAHALAQRVIDEALRAGYREIEVEPAVRGGGSSAEKRAEARRELEARLAELREARKRPRGVAE